MPPAPEEERYEIVRRIGTGGIGAVYEALDRRLGRRVAIKRLLPPEESEDRGGIGQDLLKEARALSSFQHPNIVTVLDVGVDEDGTYIVMEYIDGLTVDQVVCPIPMSVPIFLSFAEQLLDGIIAAHARTLLHRDIKPSNVMLVRLRDGGFRVKILDFGIAKFSRRPALQTVDHSQSILGSIYFMAPEQFERKPLDARTDLYQMGCLLFYALTAKFPFDGVSTAAVMNAHLEGRVRPLEDLRPDVPPDLARWVVAHLAKDPASRPASAAASLEALRHVAARLASDPGLRPASKPTPIPDPTAVAVASPPVPLRCPPPSPGPAAPGAAPLLMAGRRNAAEDAPGPSARLPAPHAPADRRSLRWLAPALGLAAVATAVAGYFIWKRQHLRAAVEPSAHDSASSLAQANPPALNLLFVRLDAAEGVFRNGEEAPSDIGDVVAAWQDLAPLGGDNRAQYHVTNTANPGNHWPKLVRSSHGSRGRSLEFSGEQRLVLGRNGGGDPILPHVEGNPFTLLVSLESGGFDDASREFVLGWKNAAGQEQVALLASGEESILALTAADTAPGRSSVRALRTESAEILIIERKSIDGKMPLRLSIFGSDGSIEAGMPFECPSGRSDLRELRLGQVLNPGDAGSGQAFSGRISGLLLYVGELAPSDVESAARYLQQRSQTAE